MAPNADALEKALADVQSIQTKLNEATKVRDEAIAASSKDVSNLASQLDAAVARAQELRGKFNAEMTDLLGK